MIASGINNVNLSGSMLTQEPIDMNDAGISNNAESVIISQSDPLPVASAKPEAILPNMVDVTLSGKAAPGGKPTPLWSMEKLGLGHSIIELGDNYALGINEMNSEVVIANRATQETTRVFGNANVETAGQEKLQFWGTTTFELANGTKITANTIKNPADDGGYMLDKLTVTNDYHALVISGVSNEKLGDLAVTAESKTAAQADDIEDDARDGYILVENETGAGWNSEHTDALATQIDLNETAVGGDFAPGSSRMAIGEYSAFFSRIMSNLFSFSMANSFIHSRYDSIRDNNQTDPIRDDGRKSDERSSLRLRLIELQSIRYAEMMPDVNDIARQEAITG